MDTEVFRWINGWPESWNPLFQLFSEGNKWAWVRVLLALVTVVLVARRTTRWATVAALVSWPLANEACDLLKAWIGMARPPVALAELNMRVPELTSPGMPSAHSANMAAIAVCFAWLAGWRTAAVWGAVAFLTGLSRVYVGAHFPSQVLGGWFVGAAVGTLVALVVRSRLRAGASESPAEAP